MRLSVDEILLLIEVLLLVLEVLVSEIALLLAKDHGILLVTRHALLNNITDCHRLIRDVRVLKILERLVQALQHRHHPVAVLDLKQCLSVL